MQHERPHYLLASTTSGTVETALDKKDIQDEKEEDKPPAAPPQPRRFHGTVVLDPTRVGRVASRIAEEMIAHSTGLDGADVQVSLEIEAKITSGVPENVVRTVTENSRTLKFTSHGFEKE